MDNSETAIPIDRSSFSGVVESEVTTTEKELDAKDKALGALFKHPDWFTYEQMVKEEIINLRQLKGIPLTGLSNEDIGENFKVANLAADTIENLLLRVRESGKEIFNNG